jgi:hypothetical protein
VTRVLAAKFLLAVLWLVGVAVAVAVCNKRQ